MAGWDKIRAAAQRPDCIFSAFPDGTDGAMYHPRTSADETLEFKNSMIEDGSFTNTDIYANVSNATSNFTLNGMTGDFTFGAKFFVKRLSSNRTTYHFAPLGFHRAVNGIRNGIVAANRPITDTSCELLCGTNWNYMKQDGTYATGHISGGNRTLSTGEWHTMFYKIEGSKGAAGYFYEYVDGAKNYENLIARSIGGLTSTLIDISAEETTVVNDAYRIPNTEVLLKTAWALVFHRCLSDEEILYLMED
jgi:hypothetical protein